MQMMGRFILGGKQRKILSRLTQVRVRKALANRRKVIEDLVKAIGEYRKSGGDHHTVDVLNKALERAELLLQ
jgi:hypothetical protein